MATKKAAPTPEPTFNAEVLREQVIDLAKRNSALQEGLTQVQAMFKKEDQGWTNVFSAADDNGMSLEELKEWSEQIKNAQVGNPHIKRGLSLRTSYVWQGGMKYANIKGSKQGRGLNVQAIIDLPANQRNFFNRSARARREGCLYADGIALYMGEESSKTLHSIPLREITADYRDPDFDADIWAYRRTWERYNPESGKSETQNEWFFTDTFADKRRSTIPFKGNPEPVSQTHILFDQIANGIDGFAYGSPDALAAVIWSRISRDATMDGITMTSAMATFAFKASVTTRSGADGASMKVASAGAGNTAVVGATNDLVPMSSAGKGYDFDSLRSIVAIVATALDVSVIALTSDPGTAGSSYGSASTLDLPTRLAMEARRDEHIGLDRRVLTWMGAKDAAIYFDAIMDPTDKYRAQQGIVLEWDTGLYSPEETKLELETLKGNVTNKVTIPKGVMLPNNTESLNRADVDADGNPVAPTTSKTGPSQGSAGSGTSTGSAPNDNAGRTDTLSK